MNTEGGILTMNVKNIMGCFMGRRGNESMSKMQNVSAQLDSKMSNLKIETENSLPQRHSKMSNGVLLAIRPVPQSGDPGCYAGRMGRRECLLCG